MASRCKGNQEATDALVGGPKKRMPGGAEGDGDEMSQVVLDDESHVVATVQEWLERCGWAWEEDPCLGVWTESPLLG